MNTALKRLADAAEAALERSKTLPQPDATRHLADALRTVAAGLYALLDTLDSEEAVTSSPDSSESGFDDRSYL